MAVTVTDQRTTINAADSTAGWTGSNSVDLFTSNPNPIEGSGCLGMVVSNATQNAYVTVSAVDMSGGTLIYFWIGHRAILDSTANGGLMIQIGDGTNRVGFHVAGSDLLGFVHNTQPFWQCLVLDTAALPAAFTTFSGSRASLNLSAITQIGVGFKTLAKAVGGATNCFWDISRRAAPGQGLRITGGTGGDEGKFLEIVELDESTAAGRAHGIIRQLGAGVYGVQGALTFGDAVGTGSTLFADENSVIVFEDRGFTDDKYRITIEGNEVGTTVFKLGNKSGTGEDALSSDGCSFVVPASTNARFIASAPEVEEVLLYDTSFTGFLQGFEFSNDATNGPNHELIGCTFRRCIQVDIGRAFTRDCVFTGYTGSGAALSWHPNIDVRRSSFTGNSYGIEHTAGGTFSYSGLTFAGNTFDINFSGTGDLTIEAVAGANPNTFDITGGGSSVTIDNPVQITLTGLQSDTEVRVYHNVAGTNGTEIAGVENSGTSFSFNTQGSISINIVIFHREFLPADIYNFTTPTADTTIPVTQFIDRSY
jgi:hypothetical protein